MKISMFKWFKSNPNVNGLMKHKIAAITPHQLRNTLHHSIVRRRSAAKKSFA